MPSKNKNKKKKQYDDADQQQKERLLVESPAEATVVSEVATEEKENEIQEVPGQVLGQEVEIEVVEEEIVLEEDEVKTDAP